MSKVVFVRISTADPNFVAAIRTHYPKSRAAPYGRKLAWAIWNNGMCVGHIGLGEAPYALSARRRLGLPSMPPPSNSACCFIYRVEGHNERASCILKQWLPIAKAEWLDKYGEELIHIETMVDESKTKSSVGGACFRRAGFRSLGDTTGLEVSRPNGRRVFKPGGTPKLVLYHGPLPRLPLRDLA